MVNMAPAAPKVASISPFSRAVCRRRSLANSVFSSLSAWSDMKIGFRAYLLANAVRAASAARIAALGATR